MPAGMNYRQEEERPAEKHRRQEERRRKEKTRQEKARQGSIPMVSNEHLRNLYGDNNGSFGTYVYDGHQGNEGAGAVLETLDKGTYTVKAREDRALFTPGHYAAYLQIYGTPGHAVDAYTRYLDLKDKQEEEDLDPEESAEFDELQRREEEALEFDDARHYLQDKRTYSQQDMDYVFSLNRHRKDGSKSEMFGTAHSFAGTYQTFFLNGIFGGMKEKFLKNEEEGGFSGEKAKMLMEEGGTGENLEALIRWLDEYMGRAVEGKPRGTAMILRAMYRSDPKHTRMTMMDFLEDMLSNVYFPRIFAVTNTDPRMQAAELYMKAALAILIRDPGARFTRRIRQLLERILAEKV